MPTWIKKSWTASSGGLLQTDSCQSYVYKSLSFFPPQDFDRLISPSQLGGSDYAHHITAGTPGCSDLPTAQQGMGSNQASFSATAQGQ